MLLLSTTGSLVAANYTNNPVLLNVGDVFVVGRDGWSNPPGGSAYDGDVLPKTDTNNGLNGDSRYYRRHNVARAWPTDSGYCFTGSDQHAGEPDPAGPQWVDYVPPFEILGAGRYVIDAGYRWSSGRASYPAVYRVYHANGMSVSQRDQRLENVGANIYYLGLGEFEMRPGSFIRVEDTGHASPGTSLVELNRCVRIRFQNFAGSGMNSTFSGFFSDGVKTGMAQWWRSYLKSLGRMHNFFWVAD